MNSGTSGWGGGYKWTFDGGDKNGRTDNIDVPTISPGNAWDPSVNLFQAPANPGTYQGYLAHAGAEWPEVRR